MERTSSPHYQPEQFERALSEEARARQDHAMTPEEVRLHLGSLAGGAEQDGAHAAQVLEPIDPGQHIYVEVDSVSAFVPRSFAPPSTLSRLASLARGGRHRTGPVDEDKYRQVLYNVNGCVRPGEVLALMGPSGSGKTTLLSIMGARAQKMMQVRGQATFNGRPLSKKLKRQVGYVMQDDLLYESLTVYETLYYAAMLRLPRSMGTAEKKERVETVIRALGLEACRGTIIGGFFRKGISGGERKRTSVGHELLINPSLLFLDEPTSGLDSTTAMHLLGVLRGLAAGGRAIVTTIHQPSSRLYQQLDKLMLLSQGHVMYYGQASEAPHFFDGLGYRLPYGVNVADFLLDLASGDVKAEGRDGEESRKFLAAASERFLLRNQLEGYTAESARELKQVHASLANNEGFEEVLTSAHPPVQAKKIGAPQAPPSDASSTSAPATPYAREAAALPAPKAKPAGFGNGTAAVWNPAFEVEAEGGVLNGGGHGAGGGEDGRLHSGEGVPVVESHRWGAPYLSQISILLKRTIKTRRFESFSSQQVFQLLAIAVLAGLFWLQKANKDTVLAARNTLGLLFFSLMFLSMRVLFVSLFTFPNEQKMMIKERASGMYRLSAFYFARLLSDLPMDFALPTVFMLIVYFMGGLRYNAAAFFGYYGTNLLAMLVAQSLGLWIGSIVMNPKSAQALASVVIMVMVLTGGFFVLNLPNWIAWLKYTSFVYYALGILLFIEFDGGNRVLYSCVDLQGSDQCSLVDPASPETSPACQPVTDLQGALGLVQDPASQSDALRNAFILLGMLLFFRVAVYWTLRKKTAS